MFFIGQSGFIITLLLTAFLPLYMLVVKPGPAQQSGKLAVSGPVTIHLIQDHFLKVPVHQEHFQVIDLKPFIQDELMLPAERNLKKRVFPHSLAFVVPSLLNRTNKAPPAA